MRGDRRRSLRHGARIQGLAFRRARRRARALRVPRGRCSARGWSHAFEAGEGPLRSAQACSIPARSCGRRDIRRPWQFPLRPRLSRRAMTTALDWSAYSGAGGGFQGAVEMCNNNGACRALAGGVMCPSYRVTRDEKRCHARPRQYAAPCHYRPARPRRAYLRRDGGDAEALRLLQGLPARVPDRRRHGTHEDRGPGRARRRSTASSPHEPPRRLPAALRARWRRRLPWLLNLRDRAPRRRRALRERLAGFSARRTRPRWRSDWRRDNSLPRSTGQGRGRGPRRLRLPRRQPQPPLPPSSAT